MKKNIIISLAATLLALSSCNKFLDPLPSGSYTNENINDYPSKIKGYVDKAYDLLPTTYASDERNWLEGTTDNAIITNKNSSLRLFSMGSPNPSTDPFSSFWTRDYEAIMYVNMFLKDDLGLNTHYKIDKDLDRRFKRMYQGDAYALRAWYLFDLLSKWGGKATNGELLGVPILLEPVDFADVRNMVKRNTFEECIEQILKDCDSALVYLPEANRDWAVEDASHEGAVRWQRLDGISIKALKSQVYLLWASPAFNPSGDKERYRMAAKFAAEAMDFKLDDESSYFNPKDSFLWTDPNSTELFWIPNFAKSTTLESKLYPKGFNGTAVIGPTQSLVDAFPMANGYPISHPASGYDPANPYEGRDPRFYSTIFYHGCNARRLSNNEIMYTFDMSEGGNDEAGGVNNSRTGYYQKKFIYMGWNKNDSEVQSGAKAIFLLRWTLMCLTYAEAANKVAGPASELYGYTAKQAIAYLRGRTAQNGESGVGAVTDAYLDECCASADAFDKLVRDERRIELCFEGYRFLDLRRWEENLNVTLTRPVITSSGISYVDEETRKFDSNWMPIPYSETRRNKELLQNEGWDKWK